MKELRQILDRKHKVPGSQLSVYSNRPSSRFKQDTSHLDNIGEIGEEEEAIINIVIKKKEKSE